MKRTLLIAAVYSLLGVGVVIANSGQVRQVKKQPTGPEAAASVPRSERALGSIRLPRNVTANGKPLPAGTYQVRVTADEAQPQAVGATSAYERWVEFLQGGQVKGREIASIIPHGVEADRVVKDSAPAPGRSKVQMLRGNEFLRVWFNSEGNHYLIHLVPTSAATP